MAVGGYIEDITYNHPTLGNGSFTPKANEEATYNLGGIKSSDENEMIDAKGKRIDQKKRQAWSLEAMCVWDRTSGSDVERMQALMASPEEAEWTFTCIDGTVYGGKGTPVGDGEGSSNATFTLKVQGSGELKKL